MRIGVVTEKVAMSRIFTDDGDHIPVTLMKIENCQVIAHKTVEKHGYPAVQIGYGVGRVQSLKKPVKGFYAKLNMEPKKGLKEFKVSAENLLDLGTEVKADHFQVGQFVDVSAVSIGKGFAGVMKRHNFKGNRASHGCSVSHRSHGSTGQRQDPGKVFKGKKMAGHLGAEKVTIQNLKVIKIDIDRGLIYLRGAVPGYKGATVIIKDSIKK